MYKNIKIHEIILFSSILLIFGCTTTSANINSSDGISRGEAKNIAKNELVKFNQNNEIKKSPSKIYSFDEVKHSNTKIDSDIYLYDVFDGAGNAKFKNAWYVLFKPKFISASTGFLAVVNKNDGEIMYTKSGNIGEAIVPLFEEKVKSHEGYMKAVINYHKENNQWPSEIDEIRSFINSPNEDVDNLTITKENEQKVGTGYLEVNED